MRRARNLSRRLRESLIQRRPTKSGAERSRRIPLGLQGQVDAKFNGNEVAPPLRLARRHSRPLSRHSRPLPRHSRESGNPNDSPPEIRYKSPTADPFSLHGLTGVGFEICLSSERRAPRGRGIGEPSQSPEIRYELPPTDPFSLYGLTGVGLAFRSSGGHRNLGDAGKGEPSQPSEIKYELKPADPFSLHGRRLG